jgi:DNA-directed RNA polymerase beta' subunit
MTDLQKEISRLQNLKQNRKKDKSALEHTAQLNLWKKQANISEKFESKEEKEIAEELFNNYLANYEFTSYNDITNVIDLVFEEILKLSIQKSINKITSDEKSTFVPDRLIDSLHKIEDTIYALKEKVGIVGKQEQNDLSALEELDKKFKTYIAFNKNEFTFYAPIICKECGSKDIQPILLRRRVKDFKALKHPFFSGRFLFNIAIIDDVEKGLITKEQASRYLATSVKYIEWAIENRHKIVEIDGVSQDTINEFIDNKPYLGKSTDCIQE